MSIIIISPVYICVVIINKSLLLSGTTIILLLGFSKKIV